MSPLRPLLSLLASALVAAPALAQLELPAERVPERARDRAMDLGQTKRGNVVDRVLGKPRGQGDSKDRPLVLPDEPLKSRAATPAVRAPARSADAAPQLVESTPPGAATPATSTSAARFVLDEVAKLKDPSHAMVDHGVHTLVGMGDVGRAAGLEALASEHASTVLLGAKVLLQFADDEATTAVLERMRTKLPGQACGSLVDLLATVDPVHASPAFLAELLAHKQSAVRAAAQRHLADMGPDLPASALLVPLRARESDPRARATTLLIGVRDPAAVGLLLERLTDPSPAVGRRALEALATREDERIPGELLRRAFDAQWILRDQALALLALVEREDLRFETHLTDVHRARLLDGMTSNDPFVSGACAAALVGVGFRSASSAPATWYDLDAPHRLVRVVSSSDFVADLSTLAPTAAKRLALIAGVDFGGDGPRWIQWWTAHAGSFHGAHAALALEPDSALKLQLVVRSNVGSGDAFCLLGPSWADAESGATPQNALIGEVYYLTETQARGAFAELARLGLFGVERLPGVRGSPMEAGRTLIVALGDQQKSFRFAGLSSESWFASSVELARALRDRNGWQALRDESVHPTAEAFWRAEAAWWDEHQDEPVCERRMWELTLARALGSQGARRAALIDRLPARAEALAALEPADQAALVELLSGETHVSDRVDRLLDLALAAARADGELAPGEAGALLDLLLDRFGASSAPQAAHVIEAAGPDFTHAATKDGRPFVRAVAATVLSKSAGDDDAALLIAMLRDPMPEVQSAVLLALGQRKVEAARDELLVRARVGEGDVRIAALRATGLLGGEGALSALLEALSDSKDPRVPPAAAQGIASLRESGAAPILISLLSRGPEDPSFGYARAGLVALGDAGVDELLRVVRSSSHRARRECALILAEMLMAQSVSPLLSLLSEDSADSRAAEELAILTCVDFRGDANPAGSWWGWWEYVVHDDAQAWLSGALSRLQLGAPTPEQLRAGDPGALALLFELLARDEAHLVERARRELSRLAGRDLGRTPPRGRERELWIDTLRESFDEAGH